MAVSERLLHAILQTAQGFPGASLGAPWNFQIRNSDHPTKNRAKARFFVPRLRVQPEVLVVMGGIEPPT